MTLKPEEFYKSDIEDKKVKLPETLQEFLKSRDYCSISKIKKSMKTEWHIKTFRKREEPRKRCTIVEKIVNRKKKWHVEITMRSYTILLDARKEYNNLSAENEKLKEDYAKLEAVNAQLMENIERGKNSENFKRECTPLEKGRKKGWKQEAPAYSGSFENGKT
jgi:hypothetical protein